MDKSKFCNEMVKKLQEVEAKLSTVTFPQPSTAEASRQQTETKRLLKEVRTKVEEALAKVEQLRANTAPSWEAEKQDLDRRWQDIAELKKGLI